MKKTAVLVVFVALLAMGAVTVWAGGQQKATTGILDIVAVTHATAHDITAPLLIAGAC